ncbi:unnamed protein product, partial [Allacma fusca]
VKSLPNKLNQSSPLYLPENAH